MWTHSIDLELYKDPKLQKPTKESKPMFHLNLNPKYQINKVIKEKYCRRIGKRERGREKEWR
jgi:hypothetical protein